VPRDLKSEHEEKGASPSFTFSSADVLNVHSSEHNENLKFVFIVKYLT